MLRLLSGLSQSGAMPLMYSLVDDFFPKRFLGTANSLLEAGSAIGCGMAGFSVFVIKNYGWQMAFKFFGYVGLALSILGLLVIKEPEKANDLTLDTNLDSQALKNGAAEDDAASQKNLMQSFKDALTNLIKNPITRYCTIGSMANYVFASAADYFLPTFMMVMYP